MDKLQENILNAFSKFESGLNGERSSDVHVKRLEAIGKIRDLGMPGKKTEDWKFTFLTPKLESYLNDLSIESSIDDIDRDKFESNFQDAIHIYNINGSWKLDGINDLPKGLHICDFNKAQTDFRKNFFGHFNNISTREQRAFGVLNTAFVKQGLYIQVDKSATIEKEIHLHIVSQTSSGKVFSQPRILIVAEENSELNVVENYHQSSEEASFTNTCTEIAIDKYARLNYHKLQLEEKEYYHSGLTAVTQERESHFTAHAYSFGGAMVRNDLDIHLMDEHIISNMFGAYVLNGKTHVDNHTSVNHAMPNCESNELYKGIMNDNSTAVFNGKIFVRKDAQKTNAFQSNRNLLLSPDATVHTKPQLEIWADDVKCSHGATIGQLDEEQLFYLRSRGITKERAISLLTHAFIGEVIEKINSKEVREKVESVLNSRMEY